MSRSVPRNGLLALALLAPAAGCMGDVRVCEIKPQDNVCTVDGDCVLAFCATDCQPCPNAYSARQVDSTYCLTRQGEAPFSYCRDGWAARCGNPRPPVCAYDIEPFCSGGKCDIRQVP